MNYNPYNPYNRVPPKPQVNQNNLGYVKSIYQAAKKSNDPMQFFQMMASNNPQLQPILNLVNSGQSPKDIFYQMCKQRGINPEEFLKTLNT